MVPSPRLIWAVAGVGFPATLALALFPAARIPAIVAMSVLVLLALIDALHRNDRALRYSRSAPGAGPCRGRLAK